MTEHSPRHVARPRSARWTRVALGAAALALACAAAPAMAGTELISRRSFIRAAAGVGPDAFELSSGTTTFDRFADDVRDMSDEDASGAHQYSVAGLDESGLQGAYAEGSAKARPDAPGGPANAQSNFDLLFEVTGEPAAFTFGAAIGCEGEASTLVRLASVDDPERDAVFVAWVDALTTPAPGGGTIERTGMLEPGKYALTVHADSNAAGDPAAVMDGSSYYNVNLTLLPASSAAAVPLPPAALSGMFGLAGLAAARWFKGRRRR